MRAWRVCMAAAAAAALYGGGSTAWENHSWNDFVKGRFAGVALTRDGRVTLAPKLDTLAETGEAAIWAAVPAADGGVYLATGHRGRLLKVQGGKVETVWAAPQPEIFALAQGADGALYAGTSPDGRVWRIANNKAEEWFDPKAKYIWAMKPAKDGSIFVATGDEGKIWRVTGKGQGEEYYATGQTHVTSLAIDSKGRLLAGSDPNGLLYRIEAKEKGFVLYDSALQEIRSIVEAPDGALYVAALGPAAAQKQAAAASTAATGFSQVPAVTTTITVTADAAAQTGPDLKPKVESPKPPATETAQPPAAPLEIPGVEKTAIYRVAADNTVEPLWSSKEENIFDLALRGSDIYFSTDTQGRIYRLSDDLKANLVVETREGEATRLLETQQGLMVATADLGKLFRLGSANAAAGSYESPVHDAGNVARWGRIEWRGDAAGGRVTLSTRSGNSLRPDKTWSEWRAANGPIASPNARYIQYKVELSAGPGQSAPAVDFVVVNYQPQNGRPAVRSLTVTPQWGAILSRTTAAPASASAAYSITVSDGGDAPAASAGTPTQTVNRTGLQQLLISWQADDPDNDRLVYSLYFRGEDERDWKLIKGDLSENTHLLEADVFADGFYRFRVLASDKLANSAASARDAELVSPPVLIDQTAPAVTIGAPRREGGTVLAEVKAVDATSPVRRAEYALDGGSWQPLDALDGVADSPSETFLLRLPAPGPGEHTVVVRVYDASGNAGLAKIVLR